MATHAKQRELPRVETDAAPDWLTGCSDIKCEAWPTLTERNAMMHRTAPNCLNLLSGWQEIPTLELLDADNSAQRT